MALVLDMVRIDPDRRPSAEMQRWHRELATSLGVVPEYAHTNRELLDGALRLSRILDGRARDAAAREPAGGERVAASR
jgi:hypothetical protein